MKENSPIQRQEGASLESNASMPSMAPPSNGLMASSLSNSAPATGGAMQLMADENAPIQREPDLRSDYPWQGIIDEAAGTLLMEHSDRCMITDSNLAHNTRVTVTGEENGYLRVQAGAQEGFIQKEHVDDVVSNHIEENMVGDQMNWDQSGSAGGTDFSEAALDPARAMPDGSPASTVNCWEMVLLAAFQVGVLDRATIQDLYQNDRVDEMMPAVAGTYSIGDAASPTPARGDFMYMNGLSHVVIAQGERDGAGNLKVWSFWPPSDFTPAQVRAEIAAGNIDAVKVGRVQDTTIEDLADWMTEFGINGNPITFGRPAW